MTESTTSVIIFVKQLIERIHEHHDAFIRCGDNYTDPRMLEIIDTESVSSIYGLDISYKIVTLGSETTTEFLITLEGKDTLLADTVSHTIVEELTNVGYTITSVTQDKCRYIKGYTRFG